MKKISKIEALKETYKLWSEIAEKDLQEKPDSEYVHGCACCEYVVQRIKGVGAKPEWRMWIMQQNDNDGDNVDCIDLCPLKSLWPFGCESEDSPYSIWSDYPSSFAASEIADAALNLIKEEEKETQ